MSIRNEIYQRFVRPYLTRKIGVYNGIPARKPKLLDQSEVNNTWEEKFISSIRSRVNEGDCVILVGAGFGISTVASAHQVGNCGKVITYEPALERFNCASSTIQINDMNDRVDLHRAYVGPPVEVKGDLKGAENVTPESLQECDVLAMDCEGAEQEIIDSMNISPRDIIVETHPFFDSPTDDVKEALVCSNYSIISEVVDNEELGIDIITATRVE